MASATDLLMHKLMAIDSRPVHPLGMDQLFVSSFSYHFIMIVNSTEELCLSDFAVKKLFLSVPFWTLQSYQMSVGNGR